MFLDAFLVIVAIRRMGMRSALNSHVEMVKSSQLEAVKSNVTATPNVAQALVACSRHGGSEQLGYSLSND